MTMELVSVSPWLLYMIMTTSDISYSMWLSMKTWYLQTVQISIFKKLSTRTSFSLRVETTRVVLQSFWNQSFHVFFHFDMFNFGKEHLKLLLRTSYSKTSFGYGNSLFYFLKVLVFVFEQLSLVRGTTRSLQERSKVQYIELCTVCKYQVFIDNHIE